MSASCCFHEGVNAVFFCSKCGNKLMCKDCYAKAHAKAPHDSLLVADVMEANSTKHIPFLETRLQELRSKSERAEKRAAELAKLKEAVLDRVHKFFTKALDDALSNREKCLVYSLDNVKYSKSEPGDIRERIALVEAALSRGRDIAGSGGFLTEDLATSYLDVERLLGAPDPVLEAPEFTYEVDFVEENIGELLNAINKVGALSVRKRLAKIPAMAPVTVTVATAPSSAGTSSTGGHSQMPGNAVTVSWASPIEGFKFDYQVEYRAKGEQNFDLCWDGSDFMSCTLRGALRPGVAYAFRARCGYKALDEWGAWSPLTTFPVPADPAQPAGTAAGSALLPLSRAVTPEAGEGGDAVLSSAVLDSIAVTVGKPLWNGVPLSWRLDLRGQKAAESSGSSASVSPKLASGGDDAAATEGGISGISGVTYQVERKRKSLFERKFQKVYEGEETGCVCGGLEPETNYEVRVRCKCGPGEAWGKWARAEVRTPAVPAVDCFRQELTSWHSVRVSWAPIPSYPADAPASASASASASSGTGSSGSSGVTYQAYKKLRSAAAYEQTPVYEGREAHFCYDRLSHETAYQFRVRGGAGGVWGKWAEVVIRTPEITAPDSIYAEANSWHEIAISWAPVPSYPGKPVTYQLTRRLQRSGNSSTRASLDGRPSGEFFGSYSRSRSLDIARKMSATTQLSDTISPAQFISPTGGCDWRDDDNDDDESRPVYEGEDTTFTCSDFKPIEIYDIQVRAGCEGAWSRWSKISITTPGLPQPTPLTATPQTWYEIALSWPEVPAPANVTLSYQVEWKFGTEEDYDMGAVLYEGRRHAITRSMFQPDTPYDFRYRVGLNNDKWSNWSDSTRIRTPRVPPPEGIVAKDAQWNCASFAWKPVPTQKGRTIKYQLRLYINNNENESNENNDDIIIEKEQGEHEQEHEEDEQIHTDCEYTQHTEWDFGRLLPDTDYAFRVRSGSDKKWSVWSAPVVIHTLQAPAFAGSVWKECAGTVETHKRYALQGNAATNIGGGWCTVVGNAPLVSGVVGAWTVRIERTFFYGDGVYVGVAPIDIDQNAGQDNFKFCGWYYECYYSRLHSGPPHKLAGKEYGPRTKNGNYVRTGDAIDVVLDLKSSPTTLAFRVAGKDLGMAFEDIPLDRPLVPAVILGKENDSVKIENSLTK